MKRHWIEYRPQWTESPLSAWVHRHVESGVRRPPPPSPIPGKGFAVYWVEVDGYTFQFASLAELGECIAVLGNKLLPSLLQLSRVPGVAPEQHWLRPMPDFTKPWRYRQKAVKYLRLALEDFEKTVEH